MGLGSRLVHLARLIMYSLNKDIIVELCDYADRPTLASLARTASLFFHPATNVIWKSKVNLVDLLKTFGPDLITPSDASYDATTTLMVKPPTSSDPPPNKRKLWVIFSLALKLRTITGSRVFVALHGPAI